MSNYSRNEVVLIRHPYSDLSGSKVRPAVVVSAPHASVNVFIVPLTSKVSSFLEGEFILKDWSRAGLNVPSSLKRGIFTVQENLIIKRVGKISATDSKKLNDSLRQWLGI